MSSMLSFYQRTIQEELEKQKPNYSFQPDLSLTNRYNDRTGYGSQSVTNQQFHDSTRGTKDFYDRNQKWEERKRDKISRAQEIKAMTVD